MLGGIGISRNINNMWRASVRQTGLLFSPIAPSEREHT